mgnify:CR=1 FL=1
MPSKEDRLKSTLQVLARSARRLVEFSTVLIDCSGVSAAADQRPDSSEGCCLSRGDGCESIARIGEERAVREEAPEPLLRLPAPQAV